jgi:hypothetical protein
MLAIYAGVRVKFRRTLNVIANRARRGLSEIGWEPGIRTRRGFLNVTDEELRRGLEVSWNNKGRPLRLASGS